MATTVPVSASIGTAQAERMLDRLRPDLVIVDRASCVVAMVAFAAGWQVALLKGDMALDIIAKNRRTDVAEYEENIALLLQTSGTTGEPKLVGLTRENLQASYDGVSDALTLGPKDRTLTLMPLTHIHGTVAVLGASLSVDAKVGIIPPRDPGAFWASIAKVQPTWLSMVPTLLQSILATPPQRMPCRACALAFYLHVIVCTARKFTCKSRSLFPCASTRGVWDERSSHQIASARFEMMRPGICWPGQPKYRHQLAPCLRLSGCYRGISAKSACAAQMSSKNGTTRKREQMGILNIYRP